MFEQDKILEISNKELSSGLYNIKIGGISLYSLIRRTTRERLLRDAGVTVMQARHGFCYISKASYLQSCVISIIHIIKYCFARKKYPTVFLSFPRLDSINGIYIDKFTDPLIESISRDDCVILETSFAGIHRQPRIHSCYICYIDFINLLVRLLTFFLWTFFYFRDRQTIKRLADTLKKTFDTEFDRNTYCREIYGRLISVAFFKFFFKRTGTQRIVGPSRDYLINFLIVSKQLGIKCYELQHGVTYGETTMYTGCYDDMFVPDYFLAFGDNKPSNVYGIDENRIVNIGWAFQDYIANLPSAVNYGEDGILVVSDPEITEEILEVVLKLARDNRDKFFYVRPHPHEIVTTEQLKMIESENNVKIQDKTINIAIVLQSFNHVLGENSTVLYEALAIHKKVGRLFYKGLNPKYLEESDRDCFWEIHNQDDFEQFLKDDVSSKKTKSIYSKFDKELFCKTIGLES